METKLQRTAAELADSISQLSFEINELKERKKAYVKEMNERIRDLQLEIDGETEQWKILKAKEAAG
jgi:FtsZ-binding cell division protein ZapB